MTTKTLPSAVLVHLVDALTVSDGGFSISAASWNDIRAGFAVSIFPECGWHSAGRVTHEDISRYVSDHCALLSRAQVVLGGWRDPNYGLAYLDVSVVVRSRDHALALAREHGQLAIWDFAACESVPTIHGGNRS